jgi:hypothetical protein
MSYSPKQWRAINHYLKKNSLIPQISAFPFVRYTNRDTKEPGEEHITNIELLYDADREKAKREAREEAKQTKRAKARSR